MKKILLIASLNIWNIGCTYHADQTPTYNNGVYFWNQTSKNTPLLTVVSATQKIGVSTKIKSDKIEDFLENVCKNFPKFKLEDGGEIYTVQNGLFRDRYVVFFQDRIIYFDDDGYHRIELKMKKKSC